MSGEGGFIHSVSVNLSDSRLAVAGIGVLHGVFTTDSK